MAKIFNDPVESGDFDGTAALQKRGREITLALTQEGIHPRDQMAVLLISMSLAMSVGLDDKITDEEVKEMLESVIPETVKMFRINKDSFAAFMKAMQ